MLDFLTLKPEAFGLDISDLSLKIAKLEKKGNFFRLVSFGEVEVPPGIIEQGEIKNEERLVEILKKGKKLVKGKELKTKYVVVSLPEEKAFLQVIQMPKMSREELREAIRIEAEDYIPLPLEEVYLDFQEVLPLHNQLDHLDILIAALPKSTVDPYLSVLKKADLRPIVFEIESQAISRALVKDQIIPSRLLIIDLGATRTSLIIFSGSSLRFTFSIRISSQELTEAISRALKIKKGEAEKLKREYGIERKRGDLKSEKIFNALLPLLTNMVSEIKKCLSYYHTHASHEHLPPEGRKEEKILLCGGGANLKGLREFLARELKMEVQLGNPWVNIFSHPLKEIPPISYEESLKYTTALGLALRGIKGEK